MHIVHYNLNFEGPYGLLWYQLEICCLHFDGDYFIGVFKSLHKKPIEMKEYIVFLILFLFKSMTLRETRFAESQCEWCPHLGVIDHDFDTLGQSTPD